MASWFVLLGLIIALVPCLAEESDLNKAGVDAGTCLECMSCANIYSSRDWQATQDCAAPAGGRGRRGRGNSNGPNGLSNKQCYASQQSVIQMYNTEIARRGVDEDPDDPDCDCIGMTTGPTPFYPEEIVAENQNPSCASFDVAWNAGLNAQCNPGCSQAAFLEKPVSMASKHKHGLIPTVTGSVPAIDGTTTGFDLDEDFFYKMYKGGNQELTQLGSAYLKYDCGQERMYVLVLLEPDYELQSATVHDDDLASRSHYVKSPFFADDVYATFDSFGWVYGANHVVIGWSGSFSIWGDYIGTFEIGASVNQIGRNQMLQAITSSGNNRKTYIPVTVPPACSASPSPSPLLGVYQFEVDDLIDLPAGPEYEVQFACTESTVEWTVPDDWAYLKLQGWGGGGGSAFQSNGGDGDYVELYHRVVPGEILSITVASGGGAGTGLQRGRGTRAAAAGGGATSIKAADGRIFLVAGGGGGAGWRASGGNARAQGLTWQNRVPAEAGTPGSQFEGGIGGSGAETATNGSGGRGGFSTAVYSAGGFGDGIGGAGGDKAGNANDGYGGGGGGGGGYFGGGGGGNDVVGGGGGGGGSSYYSLDGDEEAILSIADAFTHGYFSASQSDLGMGGRGNNMPGTCGAVYITALKKAPPIPSKSRTGTASVSAAPSLSAAPVSEELQVECPVDDYLTNTNGRDNTGLNNNWKKRYENAYNVEITAFDLNSCIFEYLVTPYDFKFIKEFFIGAVGGCDIIDGMTTAGYATGLNVNYGQTGITWSVEEEKSEYRFRLQLRECYHDTVKVAARGTPNGRTKHDIPECSANSAVGSSGVEREPDNVNNNNQYELVVNNTSPHLANCPDPHAWMAKPAMETDGRSHKFRFYTENYLCGPKCGLPSPSRTPAPSPGPCDVHETATFGGEYDLIMKEMIITGHPDQCKHLCQADRSCRTYSYVETGECKIWTELLPAGEAQFSEGNAHIGYCNKPSTSATPSETPAASITMTRTSTSTPSFSRRPSQTPAASESLSSSNSVAPSHSAHFSSTNTATQTPEPSRSPVESLSPAFSPTKSTSVSPRPSNSPFPSRSISASNSADPSDSTSQTRTASISLSPTRTATMSISVTPEVSPSRSPTPTPIPSKTPARSPSQTSSGTPSVTMTAYPSRTPLASISMTSSISETRSRTPFPSFSPSPSDTPRPSSSAEPSSSRGASPTRSTSYTPIQSRTSTMSPSRTRSISVSNSATPSKTQTPYPSLTSSNTQTPAPSQTASTTNTPVPSNTPARSVTQTPTQTPEISTTQSATRSPTSTSSPSSSRTATASPSASPSYSVSPSWTSSPSASPSSSPPQSATASPTASPSTSRSSRPSISAAPSSSNTASPSVTSSISTTPSETNTATATPTVSLTMPASLSRVPSHSVQPSRSSAKSVTSSRSLSSSASTSAYPSMSLKPYRCNQLDCEEEDINVLVFGDYTGYSDTEGRLFIGGNAQLNHYSVGDVLPQSDGQRDDLVVQGDLTFPYGGISQGNAQVGGARDIGEEVRHAMGSYNGIFENADRFDFPQAKSCYNNRHDGICQMRPTGSVTRPVGSVLLTYTPDEQHDEDMIQVYTTDCNQLGAGQVSHFEANPHGSTIFVVVSGTQNCTLNHDVRGTKASKLIWTFCDATDLAIANNPKGSVLAPDADVVGSGMMEGQLIAKSFHGKGQQNNDIFDGCIPASFADMMNDDEDDFGEMPDLFKRGYVSLQA